MARGDKADLFFRKLRSAGLSKPAVQTLAERLDALEAADSAASGASQVGAPCWFANANSPVLAAAGGIVFPQWAALTDGLAAGTDVIVDGTDPTALRVVTPGTYQVSVFSITWSAGPAYQARVKKNDDSAGPEYYFIDSSTGGANETTNQSFTTILQVDDLLRLYLQGEPAGADGAVNAATFMLTKISDDHPAFP